MSKLFEIKFTKEYVGFDEYFNEVQSERVYQVISFDIPSACARLGQIFSNEDFVLHIIDVKEV